MLWLTQNILNKTGASLAASSSNVYFPSSNILTPLACDVWRSKGLSATETLTITFDTTYVNDANNPLYIVLSGHNMASVLASAPVATMLGTSTPTYNLTPYINDPTVVFKITSAVVNLGAVLLTFTKNNAADILQMGKIYIGYGVETGNQGTPVMGGLDRSFGARVNVDYSILGQKYAEARSVNWAASLSIPLIGETMEAFQRTVFGTFGTYTPFWLVVNNVDGYSNGELGIPRYCSLSSQPAESLIDYGNEYQWSVTLDLEQQL